ncbi:MAG TPA: Uma2 family endonuclease [Bryobacteraceae bacterium]|nr:Uma2 family endonuclease [Bryobacteraceae bacterium]
MATKPLVPVEEYLRMSFEGPDPEYLDGELVQRNWGDDSHSATQSNLVGIFHPLRKSFRIHVRPEIHMRLAATRIRVADLAIFLEKPAERIPASPPLVVVEIVSPGDRYVESHDKLAEYRRWGIKHIWLIDPASRTFSVYDNSGLREVPALELPEFELSIQKRDVFE